MRMSDSNPNMRAAIERQSTEGREKLAKDVKDFLTEFDLPLEMLASITVTLGFDLLMHGDLPLFENDRDPADAVMEL